MPSRTASFAGRARMRLRLARRRLGRWAARPDRFPGLEIAFAAVALVMGISSYAVLTGQRAPAEGFSPQLVTLLLIANLLPLMALVLLIARRLAILIANRRAGRAGAHLHVRLITLFAALAAAPTILVVIFASLLFQFGVQFWFSDRARTVLDNADRVAQAYVEENKARILADILAMGGDVTSYTVEFGIASPSFSEALAFQVAARDLSEAAVFRPSNGAPEILVAESLDPPPLGLRTGSLDLSGIAPGRALVVASARDRVEAVVRLGSTEPLYLYASRKVEPRVLEQVARTQTALSDYSALTERSRALQWRFNLILLVVSLLILAAAVWFAILLASRIVAPIGALAEAAEEVGAGNLEARVDTPRGSDEIGALARSFNRMTAQLRAQQQALKDVSGQTEARSRFIEAVLSGVSAGIVSVDARGIIQLANASAEALLDSPPQGLAGRRLADVLPEFASLVASARQDGLAADEVVRQRRSQGSQPGETQTLAVRVTVDASRAGNLILTFDDITQQLSDQRRAAWSDVARRIAHEIKNPLTPIVLSAERLKRRFGPQVADGRQTFDELVDTIVRQVSDLRRMVDEFSAFARMPTPTFREESLPEIARQAVFLATVATPAVRFRLHADDGLPPFVCDHRQIGQALTNLLKNSVEAIRARSPGGEGQVDVAIGHDSSCITITIEDDGCGLPQQLRDRLFEPYVTTRQRGTGLGLAIVKRIIEDHGGRLELANRAGGGAVARLTFDRAANTALLDLRQSEQVAG